MSMPAQNIQTHPSHTIREAVGIFKDVETLHDAINDLETSGFDRAEISVLGSEDELKKSYGTTHIDPHNLEDSPDAPRSILPRQEELGIAKGILIGSGMYAGVVAGVVTAGAFAIPGGLVLTAIVGGAGGAAAGGALAKLLGDEYAEFFQKQIDEGGLLLWVRTITLEKENKAKEIFERNSASDVHVHDIPAVQLNSN